MAVFKRLATWRDQRNAIAQLNYRIDDLSNDFRSEVAERNLKRGSDEYEQAYVTFRNEYDLSTSEVEAIETLKMLSSARRWEVAVPQPPTDDHDESEYWSWNSSHGRHYLSQNGKRYIRHAVAEEMDILFRPYLSWAAIAISIVSLIVSAL
ncbi:hypothetical protein [Mesorhizobium sp.]|uniref:hypothetical protein n=1 Tax=Mesorhizobium sp. TaxID=1871066 RepID=UPI000FE74A8E|nr:hypothetical protein [Mesorhizobium sp.]RWI20334.1 MAG: hypothetical protein EOQ92_20635 [Mesorhizobium sp.]RWK44810.1 MAG: hypothetical protein EOR47_33960 [Mesorhizobium sp.]RWK95533.1 MAG: hypothetical protein EOR53_12775 [Mesorhizobium sp.]TIP56036.1 MAG: hypothetical protein E5X56_26260 [Mesorhizobium sp.]TIP93834.1 MAG: hypothetical protein E5X60_24180 [Mesorhizobium sp.]